MKKLDFSEFNKLDLQIQFDSENYMNYNIPIPFSINKFCESIPIDQYAIDTFFSQNNIILSREITWNIEIIEKFE